MTPAAHKIAPDRFPCLTPPPLPSHAAALSPRQAAPVSRRCTPPRRDALLRRERADSRRPEVANSASGTIFSRPPPEARLQAHVLQPSPLLSAVVNVRCSTPGPCKVHKLVLNGCLEIVWAVTCYCCNSTLPKEFFFLF